jgi:hypothetical protein
MKTKTRLLAALCCLTWTIGHTCQAEVVRFEVVRREPLAGDMEFGEVGRYEKLIGRVHFAADPTAQANRQIVDVEFAPRNDAGKVEWSADFYMLKPVDVSRGNRALFYDVNNRGNQTAMRMFNDAGGNDPEGAGNGFFMREGFVVLWSGWIGQVLPGGGRMTLQVPVATQDGREITGLVRAEMTPDAPAERLNIAQWANQGYYEPTERGRRAATLTWRLREADPRVAIPHEQWSIDVSRPDSATLPLVELRLSGGFKPGYIYELIYEAKNPIVQGLGLAGMRDLVSFLKYSAAEQNPLRASDGKPAIARAYAFGTSQSGRCVRQFLYDGFNADEAGRQVFDGLMPHVAGAGMGFFNHRFASPTRHNAQHDNHQYPADVFPFAYADTTDPATGRVDSLMRRARETKTVPKVMQTQSEAEYWHRAASLVHTDPLGKKDVSLTDAVRLYVFGGTQHGPGSDPPRGGNGQLLTNPADYRPFLRALLVALDAWVRDGTPPPASAYPTFADKTLVAWDQASAGFPALPGVRYPEVIQQPSHWDYGPSFLAQRIMTVQPPKRGVDYIVRVARCDADGNATGVLRLPRVAVPLGTYTGWALRKRELGAENELVSLAGSYIPFARNASEREASGDLRRAVLERYKNFDDYRSRYAAAVSELQQERLLLDDDARQLIRDVEAFRPSFE